ncbi:hypothetical protein [Streptomyces sp. NPDC059708]|uniref:hypothetical protein n=1 Tax=Streptomyces sp. NPDC059708 TaxID=3346916 RepID=UPI0036A53937
MLASETDREMRLEVPHILTGGVVVYCTDIIVARRHLPGRVLNEPVFPLLIAPRRTLMTMMLPSRYWPAPARSTPSTPTNGKQPGYGIG